MKLLETLIGSYRYYRLKPKLLKPKRGLCLANLANLNTVPEYQAEMVRVSEDLAVQYGTMTNAIVPYWVIVGKPSDSIFEIAKKIMKIQGTTQIKPRFYACINESNENTYEKVVAVREDLLELDPTFSAAVIKGPHTACIESAAFSIYKEYFCGKRYLNTAEPHVIHFYLKPWLPENRIENYRRFFLLTYIVTELRRMGVEQIIMAESHDGDLFKEGYPPQGDYVYASKEGQAEIERVAGLLGINVVQYYHSAFLHYEGNTVLNQ